VNNTLSILAGTRINEATPIPDMCNSYVLTKCFYKWKETRI